MNEAADKPYKTFFSSLRLRYPFDRFAPPAAHLGASLARPATGNKTENPVDPVRSRDYEVWTDKDGGKVIWELTADPSGGPSGTARLLDGTGKYTGWQGTMEYTLQFPKPFPEGTARGICREVVKIVAPAETK
jgi:hypothetical protein